MEELAHAAAAAFDAAGGPPTADAVHAHLFDCFREKRAGGVWAEMVAAGPHALRHPMTEYLLRTGRLHPDYFDDYFTG